MSGALGSTVGNVDSSIPLQAGRIGQGAAGNTLFADPSKMMDTMVRMQQLRLLPGQLQRQQQEIQQGDIGIQQGGLKTQSDQLALTNSQNAAVAGYLIPVLNNPDPKLNHITSAYGQAAGPGNLTVDRQVADMKTWPGDDAPLAERKAWLAARAAPAVSAQERLAATGPAYVGAADQGQTIQPLVIPGALSGQPRVVTPSGAALPTVPSVSDLGTPVHYTGPDGREVNTTKGQYAIDAGVPPASLGSVMAGQSLPPLPAKGGGAGSGPGSAVPVVQPPAGARKDMSGPTPGFVSREQAAGTKTGTESADVFSRISQEGDAARSQDALVSALAAEAKNFRPGPAADTAEAIKRTILGVGAQFGTNFGLDLDKLAAKESVDKIANQLANAAGAGSDARLHVNQGANPSAHNTPEGLDIITRQLRGTFDYAKVRQQLAAAYPNKADSQGFLANVAANLDPRVFQYNRLTAPQARDYIKGISDPEAFIAAHDYAASHGLLPSGGGGG
jgi:hypothetical protein